VSETLPPRPIPEARPPHLPDVLTRQSPLLYVFLAVALLQVWRGWESWLEDFPIASIEHLPSLVHRWVPSVLIPLYGAALFVRHRDARRRVPLLVVGLGLLTGGELLRAFDLPILRLLGGSGSFSTVDISPVDTAFNVFSGLVAIFGVLYTGAGLSAARRPERSTAERPLMIWLGALAVISIVLSLLPVSQVIGGEYPASILLASVIGIIVSVLLTAAWVYLAAVAVGGWLTRDEPRRAWICAGIGISLLFARRLLAGAFGLLDEGAYVVAVIAGNLSLFGWLMLLVAFALGLPAPPDPASADVEADATADPPAATQPGSATG
jgi:hypothetical protein